MKRIAIMMAALLAISLSVCAQTKQEKKSKTLVAYFSASGVTRGVAQSRSTLEMKDKKSRPAITGKIQNMQDFDVVYVGFPIWWYTCPTIINTFMEAYNFNGKTVIPFATSGSSSIKKACADLKETYPNVNWKEGKLLNHVSKEEMKKWVENNE